MYVYYNILCIYIYYEYAYDYTQTYIVIYAYVFIVIAQRDSEMNVMYVCECTFVSLWLMDFQASQLQRFGGCLASEV